MQRRARRKWKEGMGGITPPTNPSISGEENPACVTERDLEGDGLHVDACWYSCMCTPP